MALEPLYSPDTVDPAFCLRFTWTGWPTAGRLPQPTGLERLKPLWENDGMRFLEQSSSDCEMQLAFSALPRVSPVMLAQRAKGRLQNDLRKSSSAFAGFSRKVSVRSIGENSRQQVEDYIDGQVGKERFLDSGFEAVLRQFTVRCPEIDLSQPTESAHGRYWYNLHLVLVVSETGPVYDSGCLAKIRDGCFAIAQRKATALPSFPCCRPTFTSRCEAKSSTPRRKSGWAFRITWRTSSVRSGFGVRAIMSARSASTTWELSAHGFAVLSRQSDSPSSKLEGVWRGSGGAGAVSRQSRSPSSKLEGVWDGSRGADAVSRQSRSPSSKLEGVGGLGAAGSSAASYAAAAGSRRRG